MFVDFSRVYFDISYFFDDRSCKKKSQRKTLAVFSVSQGRIKLKVCYDKNGEVGSFENASNDNMKAKFGKRAL